MSSELHDRNLKATIQGHHELNQRISYQEKRISAMENMLTGLLRRLDHLEAKAIESLIEKMGSGPTA